MLDYISQAIQVDFGRITRVNRSKSSNSLSLSKYHWQIEKKPTCMHPWRSKIPWKIGGYIISLKLIQSWRALSWPLHCHHGWRIPTLKSMILPASSGAVSSGVNPQGRNNLVQFNENGYRAGEESPSFVFFGDSSVMQHKVVARKVQSIHRIFSWLLEHLTRVEMNRGWITAWSSQWSGNMEKHDRRCSPRKQV